VRHRAAVAESEFFVEIMDMRPLSDVYSVLTLPELAGHNDLAVPNTALLLSDLNQDGATAGPFRAEQMVR